LAVQLNPFINNHLLGGNGLLILPLLGSVFHYNLLFVCGFFLLLQFRLWCAFLLRDWDFLFTLSEKIDGEGGRECGMLRDEVLNALFFEVLDGIVLQEKRNLGTTLESIAAGIRVDLKRRFIGVAGEDVLDRVGVLGSGRRERRDVDLIRDEERTVETKTECTNEIPGSTLLAFG
jgi:hypothetical protein